jgi:hypothetical protein
LLKLVGLPLDDSTLPWSYVSWALGLWLFWLGSLGTILRHATTIAAIATAAPVEHGAPPPVKQRQQTGTSTNNGLPDQQKLFIDVVYSHV